MKKFSIVFVLLVAVLTFFSCAVPQNSNKELMNEIPKDNISYINFTFGNVIDEGKQAVFFNFNSDYTVSKIEFAGALLDGDGNVIYSFDTSMNFGTQSCNPEPVIRIEADLIKSVKSVSFSKVKAYTKEEIKN